MINAYVRIKTPYKGVSVKNTIGKEDKAMKRNLLEKVLWSVAKRASESTSLLYLYEPKMPDKLIKKQNKKEK